MNLSTLLKPISLLILLGFSACSILENEELPNQAEIDYLVGTEESGRLKRQLNFSDSEDETVGSDIEYIYKNNRLTEKIYTDYNWNEAYILQKDTFIYENGKLIKMFHYFRSGTPISPMLLSKTTSYYYPNENTRIEVTYKANGSLDDSIVYVYEGALLIEDRFYSGNGSWGSKYQYNAKGKPVKKTDLASENPVVYYYDEKGALEKTILFEGEEERTIVNYEREARRNNELVIRCNLLHLNLNWDEPFLTSHKVFKEGKLIEFVQYHPTFKGSEWFCTRYEYY
jgi:hypothetical protein